MKPFNKTSEDYLIEQLHEKTQYIKKLEKFLFHELKKNNIENEWMKAYEEREKAHAAIMALQNAYSDPKILLQKGT